MSAIQTFVVGRSNSRPTADLLVPSREDTVGRRHAEITLGEDGSIYLVDLNSSNGTFVSVENKWKKVKQAAVDQHQSVRLGEYETTVAKLLQLPHRQGSSILHEVKPPPLPNSISPSRRHQDPEQTPKNNRNGRPPRRNPATGEIE